MRLKTPRLQTRQFSLAVRIAARLAQHLRVAEAEPHSVVIMISRECRLGGDQFESINRSFQRRSRKDRSLEMNVHATPDRIDYHLTRAFVAIELQSQDRIDQAVDRLAISLLVQA
ncbi:hypothetical protein [Mycobacterium sp. UM_CSW]|uniref:hypothetical protein n=1 Tax=Mycobacterium sp. UM_CSW TaxID=1370119 RepID=UPI0012680F03|nr:hypothetical protein [Mycobacterium sp. UM_CSW]